MIKQGNISKLEVIGLLALEKKGKIGEWTLKVESENDDEGDENTYKIVSLKHPDFAPSYWKISGYHDSYEGELHYNYDDVEEVMPTEVKATDWVIKK